MRLLFLNNHHSNSNEKSKSSLKKALVNLMSRNNTSQTVKLNSSMVIKVKPKNIPKPTVSKVIVSKPTIYEQIHWKETPTVEHHSACPNAFLTHNYIRSTRSNPNQLKLIAAANISNTTVSFCKILKTRSDEFTWGKQSPLRNQL